MSVIGLLGGTFNPIHNGHILLAEYCKSELKLDRIIIIPTFTPPHKESIDLADSEQRLDMCRIACKRKNDFAVSDIEIKRKGKSYSYQTLTELKFMYPNDTLVFIMGADMFLSLHTWKNPEVIFKKADLAVVPRDNVSYDSLVNYYIDVIRPMGAKAYILSHPVEQVSSTFVRENIANANLIGDLIDKDVYDYIISNNLYRK